MDFDRCFQSRNIRIHALDLVDHRDPVFREDPVRPAFPRKNDLLLVIRDFMFQRDLRPVSGSHPFLDLPVDPSPGQHRILLGVPGPSVVDISGAQNKLHQIPDRDPDRSFIFLAHHMRSLSFS